MGLRPAFRIGGGPQSDAGGRSTNHRLALDFNNVPKGTRTAYSGDAGLFKEVKLNRGSAMASASQDA
jgi:hypothetical protein